MLFFETEGQAAIFLLSIPLGWMMALLLHLSRLAGRWQLLTDTLAVLLCGIGLFLFCIMKRENGMQLYHLLAVMTGFLLYRLGMGRLMTYLHRFVKKCCDGSRKRASSVESNL